MNILTSSAGNANYTPSKINAAYECNLPPAVSKEEAALALKLEEKRLAQRAQQMKEEMLDTVMGELIDGNAAITNQPDPVADTSVVQDAIQKYATPQATEIPQISEEEAASLHAPLTEREKALAKMFKINEKLSNSFRMTLAAMESGDEAKKAEALELNAEARRMEQENAGLFTPDSWGEFFYAMHGRELPVVVTKNSFAGAFGGLWARTDYSFMDIPPGEFSFDSRENAVQIGMGSKIPLGHFSLHVHDKTIGAFHNHVQDPHPDDTEREGRVRSFYVQSLNWLLRASHTGNASLNTSSTEYSDALNHSVLSLLQRMGVDTSREFSINGTTFNVRNGRVETQGYTPFTNSNPVREYIGADGMRQIFARAYAQNLFNPTTD
ncbi:MAG: hypothetical protein FWF79_02375 [Defluviitaleaceae bacterium]|nr:hypothetical protein [Defluviitaleaceae bacterium]